MDVILLIVYVVLALGLSFLCSVLESTLLSARRSTLTEQRASGSRGAGFLLELKQHRVDDAISAVLILNTIANTLGATLAGAQAGRVFGDFWFGVFSATLIFLILVVSEIIPKTMGAYYAPRLAGPVGWVLFGLTRLMRPALVLSRALTRLLTRGRRTSFSRGELAAVISAAARDGAISEDESELFENLLRADKVQVEDVMTPRSVVFMLAAEATIADLLGEPEADVFSRIPLYRDQQDNVVGYVLQRDVLRAVARVCDHGLPLSQFMRPILFIPELATVDSALQQILERREPIAMVTDEHGGVEGLVTLEDLTETILGVEIIDESDRVVDLRKAALKRRDERLERMRQKRALRVGQEDGGGDAGLDP